MRTRRWRYEPLSGGVSETHAVAARRIVSGVFGSAVRAREKSAAHQYAENGKGRAFRAAGPSAAGSFRESGWRAAAGRVQPERDAAARRGALLYAGGDGAGAGCRIRASGRAGRARPLRGARRQEHTACGKSAGRRAVLQRDRTVARGGACRKHRAHGRHQCVRDECRAEGDHGKAFGQVRRRACRRAVRGRSHVPQRRTGGARLVFGTRRDLCRAAARHFGGRAEGGQARRHAHLFDLFVFPAGERGNGAGFFGPAHGLFMRALTAALSAHERGGRTVFCGAAP